MGATVSSWKARRQRVDITAHMMQLKSKRDELEEYRGILFRRIKELEDAVKRHVHNEDKQQALLCLRKKALLSTHLSTIDDYLYQVLKVISDTEMAQVNLDVFEQLKLGSELLKTLSQRMKVNDIDEINAIQQSCREDLNSISQSMNQELATMDENELLHELDGLMQKDDSGIDKVDALPGVPVAKDNSEFHSESFSESERVNSDSKKVIAS